MIAAIRAIWALLTIPFYKARGATLFNIKFKGSKHLFAGLCGLCYAPIVGWTWTPLFMGLCLLAYIPAPQKVAEIVGRLKKLPNGKPDKFNLETMVLRHTYSGVVLGAGLSFFTLWGLLLIPAHMVGALGYVLKDSNEDKLGIAEGVLGVAVGLALVAIELLRGGVV